MVGLGVPGPVGQMAGLGQVVVDQRPGHLDQRVDAAGQGGDGPGLVGDGSRRPVGGDVVPPAGPSFKHHAGDVLGGDVGDGQCRVVGKAGRPVEAVDDLVLAEAGV